MKSKVYCWNCKKEKLNGNLYGLCQYCFLFHRDEKTPKEIAEIEQEMREKGI